MVRRRVRGFLSLEVGLLRIPSLPDACTSSQISRLSILYYYLWAGEQAASSALRIALTVAGQPPHQSTARTFAPSSTSALPASPHTPRLALASSPRFASPPLHPAQHSVARGRRLPRRLALSGAAQHLLGTLFDLSGVNGFSHVFKQRRQAVYSRGFQAPNSLLPVVFSASITSLKLTNLQ